MIEFFCRHVIPYIGNGQHRDKNAIGKNPNCKINDLALTAHKHPGY